MPPKNFEINGITDLKYSLDGGITWDIFSDGVIRDIEVNSDPVPIQDSWYIPKPHPTWRCRILFTNNDRRMHGKPLRRGIVNKRFNRGIIIHI